MNMAALFQAISSSIKAYREPLIFTPHSHFCGPSKDYRLILDSQLVQKSQQKEEILQNPRGAPTWAKASEHHVSSWGSGEIGSVNKLALSRGDVSRGN